MPSVGRFRLCFLVVAFVSACESTVVPVSNVDAAMTDLVGDAGVSNDVASDNVPSNPALGRPCVLDRECDGGAVCLNAMRGFPDGYCVTIGCTQDSDCGTGGACLDAEGFHYCGQPCSSSSDCRLGYVCAAGYVGTQPGCIPDCRPSPEAICGPSQCSRSGSCITHCTLNQDCSGGSQCDWQTGRCVCTAATECGGLLTCYPGVGLCGCTLDEQCGRGHRCDRSTFYGMCV